MNRICWVVGSEQRGWDVYTDEEKAKEEQRRLLVTHSAVVDIHHASLRGHVLPEKVHVVCSNGSMRDAFIHEARAQLEVELILRSGTSEAHIKVIPLDSSTVPLTKPAPEPDQSDKMAHLRYDLAAELGLDVLETCAFTRILNKDKPEERCRHLERAIWYMKKVSSTPEKRDRAQVDIPSFMKVIRAFELSTAEADVVGLLLAFNKSTRDIRMSHAITVVNGILAGMR